MLAVTHVHTYMCRQVHSSNRQHIQGFPPECLSLLWSHQHDFAGLQDELAYHFFHSGEWRIGPEDVLCICTQVGPVVGEGIHVSGDEQRTAVVDMGGKQVHCDVILVDSNVPQCFVPDFMVKSVVLPGDGSHEGKSVHGEDVSFALCAEGCGGAGCLFFISRLLLLDLFHLGC